MSQKNLSKKVKFEMIDKESSQSIGAGRVANSRNRHGCQGAERTPPGIQDSTEEPNDTTEARRKPVGSCRP